MRAIVAVCVVVSSIAAACAAATQSPAVSSPPAPAEEVAEALPEEEAIAVIDAVLLESKVRPVGGWRVALAQDAPLEVDVRLGETVFGIEWVSPADRKQLGGKLPPPDPEGQLRLLQGRASEAEGNPLILVLDAQSYVQSERPRHAQRRASSAEHQARKRLRRDVSDFLEYVRSQYPL